MRLSKKRPALALIAPAALAAAGILSGCGGSAHNVASAANGGQPSPSRVPAATAPPASIKLVIKSDDEHGKRGPEGKWHDAFLPANFTLKPGQHVTVSVENYDEMKHSFTSPGLKVDAVIPMAMTMGTKHMPGKTTFSFTAPAAPGEYEWWCALPCDPWSMMHKGFMRGEVTVA